MKKPLNLVGPQVRKFRDRKGWTQEVLAEKLQLHGWDISRGSVAKLEARLRWVSDCELLFVAKALGVSLPGLFPPNLDLKKIGAQFR
jgi:transcriptional regulator with XRE-family HTH domain